MRQHVGLNVSGVTRQTVSLRQELCGRSRRGAVSAMILVVLIVLSGMVGAQIKAILAERRQCGAELDQLQAQRLADAGMLIADAALQRNADWQGMVWEVPSGEIHQTNSALVTISVLKDQRIQVVAEYPADAAPSHQVTRIRKSINDTH